MSRRFAAETDMQKVPRAFVEGLTEAVSYTANWLKSSLLKLSEKPYERANLLAIRRLIAT